MIYSLPDMLFHFFGFTDLQCGLHDFGVMINRLKFRDLRIGTAERLNRICGYDLNSNLELNQAVVVNVFNDEQRCADSPGSSNNIA